MDLDATERNRCVTTPQPVALKSQPKLTETTATTSYRRRANGCAPLARSTTRRRYLRSPLRGRPTISPSPHNHRRRGLCVRVSTGLSFRDSASRARKTASMREGKEHLSPACVVIGTTFTTLALFQQERKTAAMYLILLDLRYEDARICCQKTGVGVGVPRKTARLAQIELSPSFRGRFWEKVLLGCNGGVLGAGCVAAR